MRLEMKAYYIVNPRAGRGAGAKLAAELPDRLRTHGLTGEIRTTGGSRDGIRLAREAADAGASVVVAVGGDGTSHEVVNGIAERDTAFGLIPVGSGNDLALALGIPNDLDQAIEILARGHESRIDLGRFDDGWFVNSLGLGFEAQVTIESLKVRGLRGFAIYLWAVVKALRKLRCPHLTIRADEQRLDGRQLLMCVGNGPRVGGGFLLTPGARPADGVFDLCLADAMGRLEVLGVLPKSLDGTHVSNRHISMLQAKIIEIESPDGFPFHADGEVIDEARHRLRIELRPRALRVLVSEAKAKELDGAAADGAGTITPTR
jgi:YegS/Rv2252/BmrU family lipid kinase